jgi:2-succinyl-5-enolpyruvyl-6-hydroxy-3-cyclohexene-1-carboxylate synthase
MGKSQAFANPNLFWASICVDELARAGVTQAVVAPGSRSTPLTLAVDAHPDIQVFSLLDERGAAYFAVGLAMASGTPPLLICTSGTAAANFYPAVIEAHESEHPLIVMTADRPPELRGTGSNQTIDQVHLYGRFPRYFQDVLPPEAAPSARVVRFLRTSMNRAYAAAVAVPGPVHLNFPFRKPLEPNMGPLTVPENVLERPDRDPFTRIQSGGGQAALLDVDFPQKGLIICGPNCPDGAFPAALLQLGQHLGYPVIADALSGLRFGPHADANLVFSPAIAEMIPEPALILQFGEVPTSKPVLNLLERITDRTRRISVQPHGTWRDDSHTLSDLVHADPFIQVQSWLESSPGCAPENQAWLASVAVLYHTYLRTIAGHLADPAFEGGILTDVIAAMPEGGSVFVGNSNPVRHLDDYAPVVRKHLQVYGNRGASGIDGVLSTALGVSAAGQQPLVLVFGDISFYHDLNALLGVKRLGIPIIIVLIHNDGGGIFHRLPVAEFDPPFREHFITPHGLDFEPVVRMFGADYTRLDDRTGLKQALELALQTGGASVIEVRTDSAYYEQERRALMKEFKSNVFK